MLLLTWLAASTIFTVAAQPTLTVTSDSGTAVEDDGWVTATWSGVEPTGDPAGDPQVWLGVFNSPAANLSVIRNDSNPVFHCAYCSPPWSFTAPVKYIAAGVGLCAKRGPAGCTGPAPLKWRQSHGSYRFHMTNMGTDAMIVLFDCGQRTEWCIKSFGVLATAIVPMADKALPRGVHLARTAEPHQMLVSWASPSREAQHVEFSVLGQGGAQTVRRSAAAAVATYTRDDVCGVPASTQGWADPQWLHHAVVPLPAVVNFSAAGGLVRYRVGSAAQGWSPAGYFKAPRPAGPETPLTIIAFADLGYGHPDGASRRR